MVFCSTSTFFAIVVIAQVWVFGLDMHLINGFFGLEMQ